MMEMLLWRCPLCATNDGLRHQRRLFGKELVRCRTCRAVWQVSRVVGKDYQLRVIEGDAASLGLDLPLAEWYDRMKASLSLSPLQDAPMTLLEAESEYLHGSR